VVVGAFRANASADLPSRAERSVASGQQAAGCRWRSYGNCFVFCRLAEEVRAGYNVNYAPVLGD
jgi:hypothetical protein